MSPRRAGPPAEPETKKLLVEVIGSLTAAFAAVLADADPDTFEVSPAGVRPRTPADAFAVTLAKEAA